MLQANRGPLPSPASRRARLGAPLACALLSLALSASAAPLPQLSQLAARHRQAIVRVMSPEGQVLSSGFFVATVGYAVAALPGARVGDAFVVELSSGARRRAQVAKRDEAGLVILAVSASSDEELFQALSISARRAELNGWLVALCHDDHGHVMPAAGGLREVDARGEWQLDLPCGRGAPVMAGEEVIGVTLRARGVTASVGAPAARVLALSRGLLPKRPTELLAAEPPAPAAFEAEARGAGSREAR